jgi:aminopeptidase N
VDRVYASPAEQFDFRNYPKASWVLHMLRSQLGPKLFREVIQTYLKRHALQSVETADLHSVFEEKSGKSLDKFFDQWLYHGGVPQLTITYEWHAQDKLAQVTIEQAQQTGDDVLLFEFPTKLRFIVDGKSIEEAIEVQKKRHEFFVRLPAEPQVVRFDPDYTVLAVVDFKQSDNMLLAQLKQNDDLIGRLLACDALAGRPTKASVAALKGALATDNHYGVRKAAAAALAKIGTQESVDVLAGSLNQTDARVRLAVVTELAKCYRDSVRDKLVSMVANEKNPLIVAAAVTGLGKFQGDESRAAVEKALTAVSFGNEATAGAFTAIRDLGDAALAPKLMQTIKDREQQIDPGALAEGMFALARVSQRGRAQREAYDFLTGYLNHPRQSLRTGAIRALGELHDARARAILEPLKAGSPERFTSAVDAALAELDKAAPLAPAEVTELRREIRQLRESQEKLQKTLDELESKSRAGGNGKARGNTGDYR